MCRADGYRDKRCCFIEDKINSVYYLHEGREITEDVDIDGLWELVGTLHAEKPAVPVFNIVKSINAGIKSKVELCPTSLIDDNLNRILTIENMCEKYKCLPFDGGYCDQPKIIMESFEVVRSTVNLFDEYEAQKANAK